MTARYWTAVIVMVALGGCSSFPAPTVRDAAVDTGVDVGPMCDAGMTLCGGACVNTATDLANCGACGHACGTGPVCSTGRCDCPPGMVRIPAGTFTMGASDLSAADGDASPPHMVTLTRSYCLDLTEVTVAAYGRCPSGTCSAPQTGGTCNWMVGGRENHPINCVDWNQARAYCQWVHGGGGDLPTEAQWEYAAAGGAMEWSYPWGNDAPRDQLCWSGGSMGARSSTCPVMSFPSPADAFGLFDMAGNVWEWTGDCYAPYGSGALVDPTGPAGSCTSRVDRGGGWNNSVAIGVRSAFRDRYDPSFQGVNVGFRCARGL